MVDGILFNSGNRPLGGAIGDLSLYGGQSDPVVLVRGAAVDRDGQIFTSPLASTARPMEAGENAPGAPATMAPMPAVPTETGPSSAVAPAGGQAIELHAFDVSQAVTSPADAVKFGVSPVHWEPQVVQQHAAAPVPAAPEHAEHANPIEPAAFDAAAPLSVPISALPAGQPLSAAGDVAFDALGAATGAVTGIVLPLAGPLSPVLDVAHDTLSATVGAVGDTLHGLAGSDPLGGMATLVSLVSVTDMFDLHPVDASPVDALADTGLGVLDTLVGDLGLVDPLLGTTHGGDHGTGIDHGLHLDHPLGL